MAAARIAPGRYRRRFAFQGWPGHDEELWERGKVGHGHASYEELVSVPLLIHYPRRFGAGVEVRECVDGANVLATILDALDRPLPSHLQGMSLLPLAQGIGRGYPRAAFTSHYELDHALRVERFKLLSLRHGPARLYDLGSKAGERKPARRPLARRWLTDLLSTFLVYQDRWRQARWGGAANHRAALPRDLESGRAPPPISAPPGDRDG